MAGGWCARCGFRERRLRKEWTGLMVCGPCYDPRPVELTTPRLGPEGLPHKNLSPEPPEHEVSVGEITADDL